VRAALLWVVMQRVVVIFNRPLGGNLSAPSSRILLLEDGTDRLSRDIVKKLPPLAVW